ncbi:radical SAM protein [Ignisphaera sp. 4213-co]|uniref:Radical SAM protein n=1 Tax=Ignisphaera cupida TaxID=3050454 RepID=A0ABD4Z6T1_9CREN|nr:radical SAM protein [Ignisphaera sp. 4213-co]MDK6028030.1 radical SAM protein [Ignisphaera sp. 4213-co]
MSNDEFVVFKPRRENYVLSKRGRPSDIKIGILMTIPYRAAVSSLFFQMAYTYLNSLENVIAYRYVFDIENKRVEALDTEMNLKKLDAILISLPFELDYVTATYILIRLGLLHKEKGKAKPIIIAGGLAASSNPLPLTDIVDAVLIGEAEDVLADIAYSMGASNPIEELENIKCIHTTPFSGVRKKCLVSNLDKSYHAVHQFYSVDEEPIYGYGIRVEASRGCPYLCAFCMEAHVLYPFRYRSIANIENIVFKGIEFLKIRRTILYSLSLFSIPGIDQLLNKFIDMGIEASIPSIRIEHLTHKRLEMIKQLGQKTITLAPETLLTNYSCRIGKCYNLESLVEAIEFSYKTGFDHVKLYLITGFPDVSIEDEVHSFKEFMNKLSFIKRRKFIEISINPLVPKPWTPYQFLPPEIVLKAKKNIDAYKSIKSSVFRLSALSPEWAFAQAVIALGDKNTSKLLIDWALNGLGLQGFRKALTALSQELKKYIKYGWENLPWLDVVDLGIPIRYLELRAKFLKIKN